MALQRRIAPIPIGMAEKRSKSPERIRLRMEEIGISQEDLASAIGATQGAISQILTGATRNSRLLPKIANTLAVNLHWVMGITDDKIDMFDVDGEDISEDTLAAMRAGIIENRLQRPEQIRKATDEKQKDYKAVSPDPASFLEQLGMTLIPEVDLHFALGGGSFVDGPVTTTMVPYRKDWLDRITRGSPGTPDVFLTRGDGDSMMPTILDDDDVIVNRADRIITKQDRTWALGYGDLVSIKRVRRMSSGVFHLMSDNPNVSTIEAMEDELRVIGRVVWIGRRM